MTNEISDEPTFNWWVKETLQHKYRIISKVKSKYCCTSHKFWMRVPKTIKEANDIDRKLGTYFCTKAISKEITNVCIVFEKLDCGTPDDMKKWKIKPECEHVNVRIIFDINMDGKFTRKSIFVADGHTTAPP